MTPLSDKTSIGFSVLAGIFALAEIINELKFILVNFNGIPYFDIVRAPILVAVITFTIIIVAWERNKIVLNHFPYSLALQDVGAHYGIASERVNEEAGLPKEDPLRVLIRRKGTLGEQRLQKIIFEIRPQYEVKEQGFSEIPISSIEEMEKNGVKNVIFSMNNSVIKERQLVYGFFFRKPKLQGEGSGSRQELYCKITVEYSYKTMRLSIPAVASVEIPSSIHYT